MDLTEFEQRELDGAKRKEERERQRRVEENAERYAEELNRKVLPNMKGYLGGLWDKKTPPTAHSKRNFLYVIARRKAKLEEQVAWMKAEKEKHGGGHES